MRKPRILAKIMKKWQKIGYWVSEKHVFRYQSDPESFFRHFFRDQTDFFALEGVLTRKWDFRVFWTPPTCFAFLKFMKFHEIGPKSTKNTCILDLTGTKKIEIFLKHNKSPRNTLNFKTNPKNHVRTSKLIKKNPKHVFRHLARFGRFGGQNICLFFQKHKTSWGCPKITKVSFSS